MGEVEGGAAPKDKAREKAIAMLRSGKAPEDVVARLEKDGIDPKRAAKLVARADDLLQDEIERAGGKGAGKSAPGTKAVEAGLSPREAAIAKGRKWMGAIALLYAVSGVILGLITENWVVLGINLVLGFVHLGLWQWAKSSLKPAAITALVLFVTVHLVSAALDPASIVQGIAVKVLFVVALVQAIRAGEEAKNVASVFA